MSAKTYQTTLLIRGDSKNVTKHLNLTQSELEKVTGAQKKAALGAGRLGTAFGKTSKSVGHLSGALHGMGPLIGALGIGKLLGDVVQNTIRQESAITQLETVIKSTGGAADRTAAQMLGYAEALQATTTFGDEVVIEAQAMLATFTDIRGVNFDRTTDAILDLSTAMGQDLKTSTVQLGKALNDPIANLGALSRTGIQFSADTKDVIKALANTGQKAKAQTIILEELERQFGGSATAARDTLGGALKSLGNAWGDLLEVEQSATGPMVEDIQRLEKVLTDDSMKRALSDLSSMFVDLGKVAAKPISMIYEGWYGIGGLLADAYADIRVHVGFLEDDLDVLGKELVETVDVTKGATATANKLSGGIEDVGNAAETAAGKTNSYTSQMGKLQERHLKASESFAKSHNELDKLNKSTRDMIESLEFEIELLGMTGREQEMATALRKADATATEAQKDQIAELTGVLYDEAEASRVAKESADSLAKASEQAAKDSQKAWMEHRGLLSGFFFEFAADGANAFNTLVDGFKAMIAKMVAEWAANKVLLGFGGIAGGLGFSGAASAATGAGGGVGGVGGLFSAGKGLISGGVSGALGSLGGVSTGVGNFFGPGSTLGNAALDQGRLLQYGSVGQGLGSLAMSAGSGVLGGFAGNAAFGGGGYSNVGALVGGVAGSVFGPVGTGVGSFLGSGVGSLFGGKNNGNNSGYSNFDLATGANEFGGYGKSFNQENVDAASMLADTLQGFADAIGGSDLAANITVSDNGGIKFGGEKFGQDTEAFFQEAFAAVIAGATNLDDGLKSLITTFEGTSSQIVLFATSIISLGEMIKTNPVDEAIKNFETASVTMVGAYENQLTVMGTLIVNYDGSAVAAAELNEMLAINRQAAYELAIGIQEVAKQMGAMFANSAQQIRESILTEDERVAAWTRQRDEMREALKGLYDPNEIAATAQEVDRLNTKIFNTLSDEAKVYSAELFAQYAEETDAIAQQQLKTTLDAVQETQTDINASINDILNSTANKMEANTATFSAAVDRLVQAANTQIQAANTQAGAANTNVHAANIPQTVSVTVDQDDLVSAEVNA